MWQRSELITTTPFKSATWAKHFTPSPIGLSATNFGLTVALLPSGWMSKLWGQIHMDNWFHHAHHKQQGSSQLYTDKTIVMTYWLIWAITPSSSRDLLF
jgi:hypothetical protein